MNTYSQIHKQTGAAEAFGADPAADAGGSAPASLKADTTIVDPVPPQSGLLGDFTMAGPDTQDPKTAGGGKLVSKLPGLEPLPGYFPSAELGPEQENAEEDDKRSMPADCQAATAEQEEMALIMRYALADPLEPNASQREAMERRGRLRRWFRKIAARGARFAGRVAGNFVRGFVGGINESGQTEVVIGSDGREYITNTMQDPFSGCTQLDIVAANGRDYVGSAALIAETENCSVFLTAAHCVYFHENGGHIRDLSLAPGRDEDNFPYGRFTITPHEGVGTIYVPGGWSQDASRDHDWAVVVVPHLFRGPNGERPHVFDFKAFSASEMSAQVGQVCGFPVDIGNMLMDGRSLFYHADEVVEVSEHVITYLLDTTGGQSGSPFWFYDSGTGKRIIAGVHTMGDLSGNSATRITPQMAEQIEAMIDCAA